MGVVCCAAQSRRTRRLRAVQRLIEVWLAENDLAGAKEHLKTLKERFPEAQGVTGCEIAVKNKEREAQQPK
jgi:hypothetical protein